MASWSDGLGRARKRRVRGMLASVNSAYGHAAPRLADPATRTHGAVGDYPANVASQVSAMRALSDRLDRDRVEHPVEYHECGQQPCDRNATEEVQTNYGYLGRLCPEHYAELQQILGRA